MCEACDGSGSVDVSTCPDCDGVGTAPIGATTDNRSGNPVVEGLACATNRPYAMADPAGPFTEIVQGGAFAQTLTQRPDVTLNLDHGAGGSGLPMARTTAGTLAVGEDGRGLWFRGQLDPDDPDTKQLVRKMARGDLNGSASFAFRVAPGGQSWSEDYAVRTITAVDLNMGDVSIVTHPASPYTSASIASGVLDNPSMVGAGRSSVATWTREQRRRAAAAIGDRVVVECRGWSITAGTGRSSRGVPFLPSYDAWARQRLAQRSGGDPSTGRARVGLSPFGPAVPLSAPIDDARRRLARAMARDR